MSMASLRGVGIGCLYGFQDEEEVDEDKGSHDG